jgi:shikimate kinase
MTKKSIILIGYMGAGKSFIGRELSKELNIEFIDLDDYIELNEKKSINNIFTQKGEVYFRKIENKYLKILLNKRIKHIISTGGGTPCYSHNLELIKRDIDIKSFYLKSSINNLTDKLFFERENRPLISNINSKKELKIFISKHLFERNVFYNQADFTIDIDEKKTRDILSEIKEKLT